MPAVILRRRWQHQPPPGRLQINPSSPFASRLVLDWIGARNDHRNNAIPGKYDGSVVGATVTATPSQPGRVTNFAGNGAFADRVNLGSVTSADALSGFGQSAMTVVARVYLRSAAIDPSPRIFDKSNSSNLAAGWGLYGASGATGVVGYGINGVGNATTSMFMSLDKWVTLGLVLTTDVALSLYQDGAFLGTESTGTPSAFPSTTTNAAIGNWNHTTGREWGGMLEYVRVLTGALTAAEIRELTFSPYALYVPARQIIYFDVPAGNFTRSATSDATARAVVTVAATRTQSATSRARVRASDTVSAGRTQAAVARARARASDTVAAARTQATLARARARGSDTVSAARTQSVATQRSVFRGAISIGAGFSFTRSVVSRLTPRAAAAVAKGRAVAIAARVKIRASDAVSAGRAQAVVTRRNARGSSTYSKTRIAAVQARARARGVLTGTKTRSVAVAARYRFRATLSVPPVPPVMAPAGSSGFQARGREAPRRAGSELPRRTGGRLIRRNS